VSGSNLKFAEVYCSRCKTNHKWTSGKGAFKYYPAWLVHSILLNENYKLIKMELEVEVSEFKRKTLTFKDYETMKGLLRKGVSNELIINSFKGYSPATISRVKLGLYEYRQDAQGNKFVFLKGTKRLAKFDANSIAEANNHTQDARAFQTHGVHRTNVHQHFVGPRTSLVKKVAELQSLLQQVINLNLDILEDVKNKSSQVSLFRANEEN
jgi:hypothetical protein